MKRWFFGVALSSVLVAGVSVGQTMAQHEHGGHQHGEHEHDAPLPECPVMGEPINLGIFAPTDDGPVFFCCKHCIDKYEANPAKYAAKVTAQRKALARRERIQVTCPVTRETVDRKVFVEHNGRKVYLCCKGCAGKYLGDPAKYARALANSFTFQTKCPVMGEEINPKVFATTAKGQNIYFCCKGCDKKFLADPAKYAPKLLAQGYTVKLKEMKQASESKSHDAHGHDGHDHGGHGHGDH